MLVKSCVDCLNGIRRDPNVRILNIEVFTVPTSRFETATEHICYIVQVKTNNASMLRGDTNTFKGSYKERVEGVLDYIVKQTDPHSWAHLDIVGPGAFGVERFVSIARLIRVGELDHDSPLVETATAYGIREALIRGRHLIGPSPGIARVLENVVRHEGLEPKSVLDLFAGSGIASIVVAHHARPDSMLIVDHDPEKTRRIKLHLSKVPAMFWVGDACCLKLPRRMFDLVVADPYYEDALWFLRSQARWIARYARRFFMVPGGVEHINWNRAAETVLRRAGLKPKRHELFGQVILEVDRSER